MRTSALLFGLVACSGKPAGDAPLPPDTDATDTDTDTVPPTSEPLSLLSAVVRAPDSPLVFQAQQADVTTSHPARVTATLTDAAGATRTIAFPTVATTHTLPLVGFPAESSHTVVLCATDELAREACSEPLPFTVSAGPPTAPTVELLESDAGRFAAGWTLFPPFSDEGDLVLLADADGVVVWAFTAPRDWKSVTVTDHGTLTGIENTNLVEMDWLGRVVRRFRPSSQTLDPGEIPMPLDNPHHELIPLADGSIYTLDTTSRVVDGFPIDYDFSAFTDANVAEQVVVHLGGDGTLLESWSLLDTLDPLRLGWSSLDLTIKGDLDWGHANAIAIDDVDDTLVISLRHQDTIVKLDPATGDVRWILANHDGWNPTFQPALLTPIGAPFAWPAHQHGPQLLEDGGILLFDNGNENHTTPYSDAAWMPQLSRVVQYRVDDVARTVAQLWDWRHPDGLYSQALGNADLQVETGSVLATFSYLAKEDGVANGEIGRGRNSTRITEFDPVTEDVVWDLSVWDDAVESPGGWLVDRAVRVGSLYGSTATDTAAQ